MEKWFDKRILIGAGTALITVLLFFAITAVLMDSGWVTADTLLPLICTCYGLAAVLGGSIAARGKSKRLQHSLTACAMLYVLVWIAALASGQKICFLPDGLWITGAIIAGGTVAALAAPTSVGKSKKVKRKARPVRAGVR